MFCLRPPPRPAPSAARSLLTIAIALLCAAPAVADGLVWTIPVSGNGELEIALDLGDITVLSHDAEEIRIEAVTRGLGASSVRFDVERRVDGVTLKESHEPWIEWMNVGPSVTVRAWVPRDCKVAIHTSARAIDVRDVAGGVVARLAPLRRPQPARDVSVAQASRSTLRLRERGGEVRIFEP
ncbi:MAG: hypothetical protein ACE5FL_01000 [Myxococcota bacterium]